MCGPKEFFFWGIDIEHTFLKPRIVLEYIIFVTLSFKTILITSTTIKVSKLKSMSSLTNTYIGYTLWRRSIRSRVSCCLLSMISLGDKQKTDAFTKEGLQCTETCTLINTTSFRRTYGTYTPSEVSLQGRTTVSLPNTSLYVTYTLPKKGVQFGSLLRNTPLNDIYVTDTFSEIGLQSRQVYGLLSKTSFWNTHVTYTLFGGSLKFGIICIFLSMTSLCETYMTYTFSKVFL